MSPSRLHRVLSTDASAGSGTKAGAMHSSLRLQETVPARDARSNHHMLSYAQDGNKPYITEGGWMVCGKARVPELSDSATRRKHRGAWSMEQRQRSQRDVCVVTSTRPPNGSKIALALR
ncbi:hypothetical protein J3458_000336 [Metarhizium acridum]|uniref:uncharacterized protein n=1 Tax=Metarhizium acridum TaxID=92637 RepID=UPI001C6ABFE9|nr:hypothetical protein J3458_000336 [Metarhizium acridum]